VVVGDKVIDAVTVGVLQALVKVLVGDDETVLDGVLVQVI